jgi:hypothetical protein
VEPVHSNYKSIVALHTMKKGEPVHLSYKCTPVFFIIFRSVKFVLYYCNDAFYYISVLVCVFQYHTGSF